MENNKKCNEYIQECFKYISSEILAIPVTVVQPGCVNGGQSKGAK